MQRIIASIAIVAGLSAAVWLVCRAAPAAPAAPAIQSAAAVTGASAESAGPLAPLHDGKFKLTGSLSCSATACHGSVLPDNRPREVRGVFRNEYYVWFEQDPHTRASITLHNQDTDGILERLGWKRSGPEFQVCLDCHSPSNKVPTTPGEYVSLEGVGCESCHGPAGQWLGEHYRSDWDRSASSSHGMIDTQYLVTRARLCADCHVGSPKREVNHDLIAAGHPALKFELSAYMSMLPKHWDDAGERLRHQDFEVQLWAIGQAVSADAALSLLEARTKRVAANVPNAIWPEFAEYDCYACHHELAYPSWRQTRGFAGRTPGMTPWGSWYFSMTERLAASPKLKSDVTALRDIMQASAVPDHKQVLEHAKAAREELSTWLSSITSADGVNIKQTDVRQLLTTLATEKGPDGIEASGVVDNWDVATQVYLAVVALQQSLRDEFEKNGGTRTTSNSSLTTDIKALRNDLAFPIESERFNSPKSFTGPTGAGAAATSKREQFRSKLIEVLPELRQQAN